MVDQKYFRRVVTYRTEKSAVSFSRTGSRHAAEIQKATGIVIFQTGADGSAKGHRTKKIHHRRDKKIHLGLNFHDNSNHHTDCELRSPSGRKFIWMGTEKS